MSDQPAEKSSTSTDASDSLTVQEADLQAAEAFDADEQDAATAEDTDRGHRRPRRHRAHRRPGRRRSGSDEAAEVRRGRGPTRPSEEEVDPVEEFKAKLRTRARRLVRHPLLRRLREPGEGEPREPHLLAQHGGLHLRGRGPHGGGHRDQERRAQAGAPGPDPRVRAGPDGPHRRVVGRRAAHPRRHRVRRPHPPAGAAEPRRGVLDAGPDPGAARERHGGGKPAKPPRPRSSTSRSASPSP